MYKAGIVGTGRIGFLLEYDILRIKPCTHAGAIVKNNPELKIVAGCDINRKRLTLFGRRYKVKNLYTDYKEMFKNEDLDLVVVSSWTNTHKEITISAIKSGVKLVVCEKPISFTLKESEQMIETAEKYGSQIIINHERRYENMYRKVKEWIKTKKYGEVKTIFANVLTHKMKLKSFLIDKSTLLHDATHMIDLFLYFFGEPVSILGRIPVKSKDTAYAVIEFKKGVRVFLEASGDRKYFNFELDIFTSNGRIHIGNEYKELYISHESPRYEGFFELQQTKYPEIEFQNPFINEYKEAIEILSGKKKKPTSSGFDGRNVIKTIELIYKSAKTGKWISWN